MKILPTGSRPIVCCVASVCLLAAARGGQAPDDWRSEAARVRQMAENDAPLAYRRAQALQTALPPDAAPAERALALNLLSRIEIYLAKSDEAARHAQQALDLAQASSDRVGQAEADLNIALNSVNQGRIDVLESATNHVLAVLDGVDRPDLMGEALLRKSMLYRRVGRFDDSVTMAMQAMEIARRNKDPLALTYGYQGLAISFEQSEGFEQGKIHFSKMREQARLAHSKYLEADAMIGLADAIARLGDPRAAETLIREALDLYREVGAPFSINHALFALANVVRQQKRFDEAVRLLTQVIGRYAQYPNPIGLWYALNARSADYQVLHSVYAARVDANQAYELAKQIGFPLYLSDSARRLAAIAAADGDFHRAYELSIEAAAMADKAARERASDRMVELAQRYETESRQRQVNELTQRNEQQPAELSRRSLERRWLWTVLGGSAFALILVVSFLNRLRRAHRALGAANAGLQRSQDELRALNASLEQQVQSRTAEATRLARTRSQFLAHMSHELRTPLNGILGFSEILMGDQQLTDKQAKGIGIIRQSGQHLLELINDLLDLARIDAAKLELEPGDVPLAGFLASVTDIIRVKAQRKSLEFRCEAGGDLPATIRADERRLRQVLLNLLSNAVKFTDSGHVALRLKTAGRDPAAEAGRGAVARLRFEVEDSGVGMTDAEAARIFDVFEQVGERRRRAGGSGLGLAISQQLVGLMGGRLRVDSRPGVGSLFWFELEVPVVPASTPATRPPGRIVGYRGPRRRVLVADDVPTNLTVMVDVLAGLGFEVSEATNGQECVERAIELGPDLILMDVTMPVMDGIEATRAIRAHSRLSRIPIIATSASATPDVEVECRAAGANAFIAKPIDRDSFLDLIAAQTGLEWVREPDSSAARL